jgi:primosomal protein N'
MEAAMFAHEARRHELALAHRIYEMHPDHAPPAQIRRIGLSLYVQGWLPYLAEADAQALLARADLARSDALAAPPAIAVLSCPRCDRTLEIAVTAHRIVCAHCGRPVDVPKL